MTFPAHRVLKYIVLTVATASFVFGMFLSAMPAQAQTADPTRVIPLPNPLKNVVKDAFTGSTDPRNQGALAVSLLIGRVLQLVLGLVGVVGLVVLIVGGVILLTAGGNDERIAQGRKVVTGAFLGLLVIFAGYSIIELVLRALKG